MASSTFIGVKKNKSWINHKKVWRIQGSLAKTCVEEENQENPDLCCCALWALVLNCRSRLLQASLSILSRRLRTAYGLAAQLRKTVKTECKVKLAWTLPRCILFWQKWQKQWKPSAKSSEWTARAVPRLAWVMPSRDWTRGTQIAWVMPSRDWVRGTQIVCSASAWAPTGAQELAEVQKLQKPRKPRNYVNQYPYRCVCIILLL